MNKGQKAQNHHEMEEEMIPDEFSDEDVEDDIGYEEVEEKFQPRESISSRGGAGRRDVERYTKPNRPTYVAQNESRQQPKNYNEVKQAEPEQFKQNEASFDDNRSSSVISEVVENKVVYLDSDEEKEVSAEGKIEKKDNYDRDKQIQEYLDVDKNAYVNKDEYEDGPQDEEHELTEEQQRELENLENRKQQLLQDKEELEAIIGDLEGQLDQATPILQQAHQALSCLTASDIVELKSFNNPPEKVKTTAEAIMMTLEQPTDWKSFKKLVAHSSFLQMLMKYDVDNMSEDLVERLDDFIEEKDLSNYEAIRKTSVPASNLANWVVCVNKYAHIEQTLKPLFERKKEAEEILTEKLVEIQKIEQTQEDIINGRVYNDEEHDIKHAGLQTSYNGRKHVVHYEMSDESGRVKTIHSEVEAEGVFQEFEHKDQSEIGNQEYQRAGHREPFHDNESLYYISNEIKKKDQSRKFVLWETNQMRNQWDERSAPQQKVQAVSKTNSHQWTHEPSEKSVSVIDSRKPKGKLHQMPKVFNTGDAFETVPKKDHYLNNVFLQSNLQERLGESQTKEKAPWSHDSLNKNQKPKNYMVEGRPLFGGQGNHVQNINSGRSRIFYSSNVF